MYNIQKLHGTRHSSKSLTVALLVISLLVSFINGFQFGTVNTFKTSVSQLSIPSFLPASQQTKTRIVKTSTSRILLKKSNTQEVILDKSARQAIELEEVKNDVVRTLKWVGAAVVFAAGIGMTKGSASAVEFCTGYVLEQCLSVDNLFVFLVLFEYFGVRRENQDKVLGYGIWGAVVLRGIFISLGAVALSQFHQILLLFAAILMVSSLKILFAGDSDEEADPSKNPIVQLTSKYLPTTDKMDGDNFFTMENGIKKLTPMLLCLICVELSDVVFAFDSVPAVFGVTEDPFIVFTSNIFAIAGLRSLYGVLSIAVEELEYLEKAVGAILGIIAIKLGFETFDISIMSPLESLLIVLSILGTGVGLSLYLPSASSEEAGDDDDAKSK